MDYACLRLAGRSRNRRGSSIHCPAGDFLPAAAGADFWQPAKRVVAADASLIDFIQSPTRGSDVPPQSGAAGD